MFRFTIPIFFSILFFNGYSQNNISVNTTYNWLGYINVFDLANNYQFGSSWAIQDLKTEIDLASNTITLKPNFNTYNDNPGDPFWQNGNTGAKLLEASSYVEPGASFNGNDLTFSGSVVSNTLNTTLYSAKYFIKALDPNNGYVDALGGSAIFDLPLSGAFSVSVPAGSLTAGLVVQYGFVVFGLNANPVDESALGSVVVTGSGSSPSNYTQLVWADEFDVDGQIDPSKWYHQTILPNGVSWFNGELQHYTDRLDNSYVDNGLLHLVAKKENFTDQGQTKQYTSARLNSKFAFTNGRVEVRAKLPNGVGTWPAIWMLGKNINENGAYWQSQGFGTTPWPACGEIDIMEHWGNNQNYIQSALHTPSSFGGTINHGGIMASNVSTTFHEYAMEWTEYDIKFSIDGLVYYTYSPSVQDMSTWPFIDEQFLLLNIAIEPSIDPSFNQSSMVIDYVRVYQEPTPSIVTENNGLDNFIIYPNPTSSNVTLRQLNDSVKLASFLILDSSGKVIRSSTVDATMSTIDLEGLAKGIYQLQLNNQDGIIGVVSISKQ